MILHTANQNYIVLVLQNIIKTIKHIKYTIVHVNIILFEDIQSL